VGHGGKDGGTGRRDGEWGRGRKGKLERRGKVVDGDEGRKKGESGGEGGRG